MRQNFEHNTIMTLRKKVITYAYLNSDRLHQLRTSCDINFSIRIYSYFFNFSIQPSIKHSLGDLAPNTD
jgi:hypothetical protein